MMKKASKTSAPSTGFNFSKIDMKTLLSAIQAGAAQGTGIPGGQESSSDCYGTDLYNTFTIIFSFYFYLSYLLILSKRALI